MKGKKMNQAAISRERVGKETDWPARRVQVVAVVSGKGGVGKTNVVANLAMALSLAGRRVLVLDADLGLGNLDVLLGLIPRYTLGDVLAGEKRLTEVLVRGPGGMMILPASSGRQDLTALTREQQILLQDELEQASIDVDVMLLDTGAGISSNVLFFAAAAQEILVVASPEPTSITDAYAVMKVLSHRFSERHFRLLVNMANSEREAREVYKKIGLVADRFLNISIDYVGYIPLDHHVQQAVCKQQAVLDAFPHAPASQAFHRVATAVRNWEPSGSPKGTVQFFWHRLVTQQ